MAPRRILVVGGGYVGLYTALHLQKKLSRNEATITVVDPQPHMTYQPFLPEAAAGSLSPRHVVVPLRRILKGCRVVTGRVTAVDHAHKNATVKPIEGEPEKMDYDVLVYAPGSISRLLPIPGLADRGIGFKGIGEATYLRNHVLSCLDAASSTDDPDVRRRAMTFCVIGGGYSGVELLGELEDMARYAIRKYYTTLDENGMHWLLVEAAARILPEVSEKMGLYTVERLLERGIDVRLKTRVESMLEGHLVLSDGDAYDCDTIAWTAGAKANPLVNHTDLPHDDRGRVRCTPDLRVEGLKDAWSAGDCAAVPDLAMAKEYAKKGKGPKDDDGNPVMPTCGPSAQHAVRQANRLAANVVRSLRSEQPVDYVHKYVGSVASLGLYKGVAEVYGIKLKGALAWFMHRTYHLSRMPTFNRKVRVVADWTLALFFKREVVSLGELEHPRAEFQRASVT